MADPASTRLPALAPSRRPNLLGMSMTRAMAEGFDFVAMGRALLKEPGLIDRIRQDPGVASTCIHCNRCMPTIYRGTHCPIAQAGS
ncbi:hypothetical protein AB0K18_11210 [Nonomuraea sp. NPDC049421]|uniref:hypothetical protein n=1 Tax=Nonomuraea sp. NPDC049421 TaxID=3155275 RepID=UPI00341D8375